MTSFLNKIAELLSVKSRAKLEEEYLAQSHSLADLERRQRLIQNKSIQDWV